MSRAVVRESVTVAGRAERARVARTFVGAVVGPVRAGDGVVRVEVAGRSGRSGPGVPELRPADRGAEGGRGLRLVAGLAARWGWLRRGGRTVTWFELAGRLNLRRPAVPWRVLALTAGAGVCSDLRRPAPAGLWLPAGKLLAQD
jgi:hypothetical protein